jgi:hypothetical protein
LERDILNSDRCFKHVKTNLKRNPFWATLHSSHRTQAAETTVAVSYWVVSHKTSHTLRPCLIYCVFPVWHIIIPDSSTRALWQQPVKMCSSKEGENWREMSEFCLRGISFRTLPGYLTCRKILRHGTDGFTSPPKEVAPLNFIAL